MHGKAGLQVLLGLLIAGVLSGCGGPDNSLPSGPPINRRNVVDLGVHTFSQQMEGDPVQAFPVRIQLQNPTDVAGLATRFLYDATKFEVVTPIPGFEATENSVFPEGDFLFAINYECDAPAVNGKRGVTIAIASRAGSTGGGERKGVNTSGILLTLFFRPLPGVPAGATGEVTVDPNFELQMVSGKAVEEDKSDPNIKGGFVRPGQFVVGPPGGAGAFELLPGEPACLE